ncbi:glycerophosphodiester phosphodiesterase [Sphingomonas sp. 37zxx]|uniref:glycerophosphodiester phosphodiesterase n=1 Tax=Sphingomonas sp. 37zxx TaxID=1550073 RepID=UPI0018CF00E6|nr:glycerophosphodiester phosphodiesterase family protein [Sphingomonas sp. 37zxx]
MNRDPSKYWSHRGIFYPTTKDSEVPLDGLPENSLDAITRAQDFGIQAVEIDVRLSSDNVPIVTHDKVTNRVNGLDGDGGKFNPKWYEKMGLPMPDAVLFANYTAANLNKTNMKAYDAGSRMSRTTEKTMSLYELLVAVGKNGPLLILDIQDPETMKYAAEKVRDVGLQNRVVLKFFASAAVPDRSMPGNVVQPGHIEQTMIDFVRYQITIWGEDLWYIIQFNDSQLTAEAEGVDAGKILKYGKLFDARTWSNAFRSTGRVIGVGISKPTSTTATNVLARLADIAHYYEMLTEKEVG